MSGKPNERAMTAVREAREEHPEWTLRQVGAQAGVSKQRAHQLLCKTELPTRSAGYGKLNVCETCGKLTRNKRFCSHDCQFFLNRRTFVCSHCGKTITRPVQYRETASGRYFCNKHCQGKWLYENHGPIIKRVQVRCDFCGKELLRRPSMMGKRNYCNPACYHASRRLKPGVCRFCGKSFDKAGNSRRKFCSRACYNAYHSEQGRVARQCVRCRRWFTRKKSEALKSKPYKTYCSRFCSQRRNKHL